MVYQTKNSYTGEAIKTFPDATDAEVSEAISKAHKAFLAWRETSFEHRASILQKAADLLRDNADELAALMTLEMGKILPEALGEVEVCVGMLKYYVKNAERILAPVHLPGTGPKGSRAKVVHQPLGVLLCVEPWNFPYYQVIRMVAPQLAAGNTMLLKHASNVPQCAARLVKVMLDAGLPEGCFTNLYATRSQVNTIIQDPRVHGVALTGSEGAGAAVAMEAAKALKKSTMELGGADAFIVLKDAELEKAVKWGVFGRHWGSGQVCTSSKRMIVADEVFDDFKKLYTEGVAALKAGDPIDTTTTLGPLSSEGAVEELKRQVKLAVDNGATAIECGPKVPEKGAFLQPTILLNVTPSNPAYHMEFFGPVTMVFRFKTEEEAIAIANDSAFGLGGSVFTRDEARGEAIAAKIETGMMCENHPCADGADLPFGGIKRSGYGRELTDLGIKEFINQKVIQVVPIDDGL